jgi:hypothetical protein
MRDSNAEAGNFIQTKAVPLHYYLPRVQGIVDGR